jgi:hypothetical protein
VVERRLLFGELDASFDAMMGAQNLGNYPSKWKTVLNHSRVFLKTGLKFGGTSGGNARTAEGAEWSGDRSAL